MTARSLLHRFGTLRAVVLSAPDEWQAVEGMGPARTLALGRLIDEQWTDRAAH